MICLDNPWCFYPEVNFNYKSLGLQFWAESRTPIKWSKNVEFFRVTLPLGVRIRNFKNGLLRGVRQRQKVIYV